MQVYGGTDTPRTVQMYEEGMLDKQGRGATNAGGDDDDDDDDATYSMATNTNADNDMTYDNVQKPAQMEDYEAPGFDTVESSDNAVVVDSTYVTTKQSKTKQNKIKGDGWGEWRWCEFFFESLSPHALALPPLHTPPPFRYGQTERTEEETREVVRRVLSVEC